MAKRLFVLVGMLAMMLLAAAVPVLAQEASPPPPGEKISVRGVVEDFGPKADGTPTYGLTDEATGRGYVFEDFPPNMADYVGELVYAEGTPRAGQGGVNVLDLIGVSLSDSSPSGETATLAFELTVKGEPPADAQFFGLYGRMGELFKLTDPNGDGVYAASINRGAVGGDAEPVQIVQGNGKTLEVIRDFGLVEIDGDETFSASVSFPEGPGGSNETATVTFELTIDGEVPDGKTLSVDTGIADVAQPVFCSTIDFDRGNLPVCEDGETYSDTFEISAGSRLSYEYAVFDLGYGGSVETFAADTRTFTGDETVSATYRPGEPGNKVTVVEATGTLEKPGATTYQYGTHAITDEASDTFYALRSNIVDLDDYLDEQITLYGALAPGYEAGQVEGGPPLLDVYKVDAAGGPGEENVAVTFELAVEGEPPTGATFFGYLGYEPAPFRLVDPDGDGVYTGSTPPDLVPAGDTQPALIVQGTGTRESQVVGISPGDPVTTIKDFGEVTFEENTTLSASVSFEDGNGGSGNGGSGSDGSGSAGSGSAGSGSAGSGSAGSGSAGSGSAGSGSAGGGIRGFLPSTGGGMALTVLGAGILLIGGGLTIRRLTR